MGFKNLIVYIYVYVYMYVYIYMSLCVCMVPKIGGPYFLLLQSFVQFTDLLDLMGNNGSNPFPPIFFAPPRKHGQCRGCTHIGDHLGCVWYWRGWDCLKKDWIYSTSYLY